ncbi:MAG TPA: serine hydrolase [Candidatus Fimenecus excrementigallinarum]|uniref:Serine hydrolase n=1 Tax=Candidatus Fimenecus excrementigallinarum TaxID=2840816 RepID=A0A9D1IDB2_9FIRM|nr:serine hydrolase [Candidatus Fimenecus excrementigallinarum]
MRGKRWIWLLCAALLAASVLLAVFLRPGRQRAEAASVPASAGAVRTAAATTAPPAAVSTSAPTSAPTPLQAQQQALAQTAAVQDTLAQALDALVEPYGKKAAVSYRRLSDNALYLYNPDTKFHIASLVKAPYCMWLLDRAAEGDVDLQETLTLRAANKRTGAGTFQYAPDGTTYSVSEVIAQTIRKSDNTAFAMLRARYGTAGYIAYTENFALAHPEDVRQVTDGRITARDADRYLLALERFFRENPNGGVLETHLRASEFRLIRNVESVQKWGDYSGCYSVMGLVCADEPYLLSVLTRDFANIEETARLVGRITDAIEKNS